MTDRICSRHGNVIAADFRPRLKASDITVNLATETLYHDGHVVLIRTVASFGGKHVATVHTLGDLATGHVTTL